MAISEFSPAEIIRALLIIRGFGHYPTITTPWAVLVNTMPDEPDDCICIYDTAGPVDGHLSRRFDAGEGGQFVYHPGVQIRTRASDARESFQKLKAIQDYLATVARKQVEVYEAVPAVDVLPFLYTIQAVHMRTPIILMGEEPERERFSHVANFNITINEPPVASTTPLTTDDLTRFTDEGLPRGMEV